MPAADFRQGIAHDKGRWLVVTSGHAPGYPFGAVVELLEVWGTYPSEAAALDAVEAARVVIAEHFDMREREGRRP
jgi:hypothetical protein